MNKNDILKYVASTPHNTNPNMIGNMIDALMESQPQPEPEPTEPTVTYETVEVDFILRDESAVESFNSVSCTVATTKNNIVTIGPDNVQLYKDLAHRSNLIAGTPILITPPTELYELQLQLSGECTITHNEPGLVVIEGCADHDAIYILVKEASPQV